MLLEMEPSSLELVSRFIVKQPSSLSFTNEADLSLPPSLPSLLSRGHHLPRTRRSSWNARTSKYAQLLLLLSSPSFSLSSTRRGARRGVDLQPSLSLAFFLLSSSPQPPLFTEPVFPKLLLLSPMEGSSLSLSSKHLSFRFVSYPGSLHDLTSPFPSPPFLLLYLRFSGATTGFCIGHVCPEAARGGPIGAVRTGDKSVRRLPVPRSLFFLSFLLSLFAPTLVR